MNHYEVKETGIDPYQGDNLGVYCNGVLKAGFNTLGNDYAYHDAHRLADYYKRQDARMKIAPLKMVG